jgi:hypothetical protein
MEVRRYEPGLREAWNGFNAVARNGHFLFDRGYMEYHADRFADASLMVFQNDRLCALLPADRSGETVRSHQGLTFGGLVVGDLGAEAVMAALDACAEHWRAEGAGTLVYKALPWIYARRPAQEDLYWLFRRDARLVVRNLTVALRPDRAGPVSELRRRGAAKAARAGVGFTASRAFDRFWPVLEQVLGERHGARPVHSLSEIVRLADAFPEAITLHLAEADGAVLGGVVLFETPEVRHCQYIAASPEGRAAGVLDGLFAHLIATTPDGRFFDFGTSNEDGGRVLNGGLVRQKEGFGASGVAHDIYEVAL